MKPKSLAIEEHQIYAIVFYSNLTLPKYLTNSYSKIKNDGTAFEIH